MSAISNIRRGKQPRPRRIFLYGTQGVGKSTWAAMAGKTIFLPTEDGIGDIDCASFPLAGSYAELMGNLEALYNDPGEYNTIAVDSLDWLEMLIWRAVAEDNSVANIEEIGYGKGYKFAADKWREFLLAMNTLRSSRGFQTILIAHSKTQRFDDPQTAPYDRYMPRLHDTASAMVSEWADEVLFACYEVFSKTIKEGFGKETTQAIANGRRIIRTVERPSHIAKNRIPGLPEVLDLDWREFAKYLPAIQPAAGHVGYVGHVDEERAMIAKAEAKAENDGSSGAKAKEIIPKAAAQVADREV